MAILISLLSIPLLLWILKPFSRIVSNKKPLDFNEIYAGFKKELPYLKDPPTKITSVTRTFKYNPKEEEQSITIKAPSFDVSKIKEYTGTEFKQFEFRPRNSDEFIGQSKAKEDLKTIIKIIKREPSHIILKGIQGHGKTAFVYVFKNELEKAVGSPVKIIERVGKQVDIENLIDLINEINTSEEKYVILFVDETDTMKSDVLKIFNPILEQFKIAGKKIKPFIFCGATINFDKILDNNPDTLDRIHNKIQFKRYTIQEIKQIILQYQQHLYPKEKIPQEVLLTIAKNCKFNPRNSLTMLKKFIVEQDIDKILRNSDIIKDGLTDIDIKLLKKLEKIEKPIGAGNLASKVGLKERQYLREYEPFLVEYGYIDRTPRRCLGDKGKEILDEISKI